MTREKKSKTKIRGIKEENLAHNKHMELLVGTENSFQQYNYYPGGMQHHRGCNGVICCEKEQE